MIIRRDISSSKSRIADPNRRSPTCRRFPFCPLSVFNGAMQPLPIDEHIPALTALVTTERAAVIVAPPGSGKTTRIPPALAAHGRTILLQPRRIAARTLTRRIAFEQGWTVGDEIGWQIRFERRFSAATRLLVATEGVLTARLQHDPLLSEFDIVILDEFHERSIYADLALALVRQAAHSRDDLAVVVMSATIDAAPVARFLDFGVRGSAGATIKEVSGRSYPIEVRHRAAMTPAAAIAEAVTDARGDILCFLPGAREIQRTADDLSAQLPRGHTMLVVPLHGSLDVDAQERALAPAAQRKIVLATNVAETSLTVEGVSDVIDAGLQKVLRYDSGSGIDRLETERIPRDAADQRAGRAGRTGPGRATRLWDERDLLRPHREPEIRRIDLASTVLDVIAWGADPRAFEWFEAPAATRLTAALELLMQLDAIELDPAGRPRLTASGQLLRAFPLHPRLARVLVAARGADSAASICAALSEGVRARAREATEATRSDALPFTDLSSFPQLRQQSRELSSIAQRVLGKEYRRDIEEEALLRALLAGYPDRVAMRREPGSPRLLLSSGTGAILGRESGVREGELLIALDVGASDRTGADALMRLASVIERDWITPTAREVVHELTADDRIRATERIWYQKLLLREQQVRPDRDAASARIASELQARIEALDSNDATPGRPLDDRSTTLIRRLRFAGLEVRWSEILPLASAGKLAVDDVDLGGFLPYEVARDLGRLAPATLRLPSGRDTRLEYRHDGTVFASVKLQELFGLAETPLLGAARTPVTFALLAPNGRPVQITADLRSFWNSSYPEVRKELRGRYPKHPWPDDPWTAVATHRAKPRR
jgi:ATP-dependent helicase HrpB